VSETKTDPAAGNKKDRINGSAAFEKAYAKASASPPKAMLAPKELAELRDRLVAELNKLDSAEQAANCARRVFGAKYRLMAGDAARRAGVQIQVGDLCR
jgi:ribosomal protein L32E